jgi:hypothetical protein
MNTIEMKTKTPTIEHLRKAGWKVRVIHKRPTFEIQRFGGVSREFKATGGETKIAITSPDGKIDSFGQAFCADEDHFDRKMGNKIALGRAWKLALDLMNKKVDI